MFVNTALKNESVLAVLRNILNTGIKNVGLIVGLKKYNEFSS